MKNKWILNFLLIALSFNAVSPLLATNLAEDVTVVLNLNPLSAMKNCWNGFVDSASSTYNSATESASKNNVLRMLGYGLKEVWGAGCSVGSGLASLAGKIPSLYFEKPETLEGFNKGRAAFSAVLGISAYFIGKQFYTLYTIRRKIRRSEDVNAKGEIFLFGSWKYRDYRTYKDISDNTQKIRTELENEAKNSNSRIYIFDNAGNRISPKDVTVPDIKKALDSELEKLRTYLETIGSFTDAPWKILELVLEESNYREKVKDLEDIWYQEAPFSPDCTHYFAKLDLANFENFGNELINQKCNSYIKRVLFTPPGWIFHVPSWRFGNVWYKKATKWYWMVYTRWLRTYALLEIMSSGADMPQQLTFEQLLEQVSSLIKLTNRDANEDDRAQQITRLTLARRDANELQNHYKNTPFAKVLGEINGHFKSTNLALVGTNELKPNPDAAKQWLTCAEEKLTQIINLQKKNN